MTTSVTTWADGFGIWHVRVPNDKPFPEVHARENLRYELLQRENNVADEVWNDPIRVPDMDTDESIVYRERFIGEDAD